MTLCSNKCIKLCSGTILRASIIENLSTSSDQSDLKYSVRRVCEAKLKTGSKEETSHCKHVLVYQETLRSFVLPGLTIYLRLSCSLQTNTIKSPIGKTGRESSLYSNVKLKEVLRLNTRHKCYSLVEVSFVTMAT